ncbi:hypothetical protein [Deinococcus cellulosilyticus]|uniref:hypothetical protein n=2 Tax=Deinococcus cellulosilyticus TaxID=401558 RepID=UPI00360E59F5
MITVYPQNPELEAQVKGYLLQLLPPERVPAAGGIMDQLVTLLSYGLTQHQIAAIDMVLTWFARFSSPAGLDTIAAGKRLSRFTGENSDALVSRVNGAFPFWELAGTKPGMLLMLHQMGYAGPDAVHPCRIIEHYEDEPDAWAEFSVILYPDRTRFTTSAWDDGLTWNDGTNWDAEMTANEQQRIRALINQVKPAHAKLRDVFYMLSGDIWDDGLTWDDGEPWDGSFIQF